MTPGRVTRLLLFGFVVAIAASTAILIGYQTMVFIAVLITAALLLGVFLKRSLGDQGEACRVDGGIESGHLEGEEPSIGK
jgi:hypothetical protein